jgi:hypothetical protein
MGLQDEYKRSLKVVEAADFTISRQVGTAQLTTTD